MIILITFYFKEVVLRKKFTSFNSAKKDAEQVLESDERTKSLIEKVLGLLKSKRVTREIGKLLANFRVLVEMIKAYLKGDYKEIPWNVFISIVAGLIYFIAPIDAIPDFIFGIGYADDSAVIAFLFKSLSDEIEVFQRWKNSKDAESDYSTE